MIDSGNPGKPAEQVGSSPSDVKADANRKRPPPIRAEATPCAGHESVDVHLDLLGRLLKHTGEASIYRARMVQQNKAIAHELENFTQTIGRMRKRLAALEPGNEAQELLVALNEDTSDLSDSGKALGDLSRDTDTLLQQQAAVNSDLQDGLLKARGLSSSPIITDVLLVKVADKLLAIPHGNVHEIIRATPQELVACYQGKTPGIAHAGAEYPVRHLGTMLGLEESALSSASKWYPVLLAGPAEKRKAIQLDQLLGSIQVMVQPLGAQLDSLHWFTGGTILADGRIALLLDLNILLEKFARDGQVRETRAKPKEHAND